MPRTRSLNTSDASSSLLVVPMDLDAAPPAMEEEKVDFTWLMSNAEVTKFIREKTVASQVFFGGSKGNHGWQLEIKGMPGYTPDASVSVKLVSLGDGSSDDCKAAIRFQFDISFPRSGLSPLSRVTRDPLIVSVGKAVDAPIVGLYNSISQSKSYGYSDDVKIVCKLWVEHPLRKTSDDLLMEYQKERQLKSLKAFMKSVMTDNFADVTLKIGNEVCRVHKCILAGRSNVFAAMFASGMKEAQTSTIKIDDEPSIVKAMLNYMYCGDISAVKERPYDMLKMADKYQLLELKNECEKFIVPSLTVTNAGQALLCAYELNLKTAMPEIMKFVNRNRAEISKTKSLNDVFKRYPQLILDLYLSQ